MMSLEDKIAEYQEFKLYRVVVRPLDRKDSIIKIFNIKQKKVNKLTFRLEI